MLNDGDTIKYVEETYNDLSAKLFKIKINSEEIKTKTLNFKIDNNGINMDYVKVLVFGLSDNNLTFIAEGNDFTVGKLQFYDTFLVCVVNSGNEPPYAGTSKIDLDIKVSNDLPFHHCDIKIRVVAPQDQATPYWEPWWWTDGYFKDNVFRGTINSELQGGNAYGTINAVVDENHNLASLSVMAYSNHDGGRSEWGITAANIPPSRDNQYGLDYKYYGVAVCNYVTSIYAKYTDTEGNTTELNQRECDENSIIEIEFHNWR